MVVRRPSGRGHFCRSSSVAEVSIALFACGRKQALAPSPSLTRQLACRGTLQATGNSTFEVRLIPTEEIEPIADFKDLLNPRQRARSPILITTRPKRLADFVRLEAICPEGAAIGRQLRGSTVESTTAVRVPSPIIALDRGQYRWKPDPG